MPTSTIKRMTVSRCVSVIRSVERIELPSTKQLMIWVRRASGVRFILKFPLVVYIYVYVPPMSMRIYTNEFSRPLLTNFVPSLAMKILQPRLSVSTQAIRQARLEGGNKAHREPPEEWKAVIIRLAEKRVMYYRKLIDTLRQEI